MIEISKEEAAYLREKFKQLSIQRTKPNKGARRGKRYVEESPLVLRALETFKHSHVTKYGGKDK